MSVHTLHIHFPFRHLNDNSLELPVTRLTLVSDALSAAVAALGSDFPGNPDDYGLYLRPCGGFLLPQIHLWEYADNLLTGGGRAVLEFRHKNPRAVRVTFLNFQTEIYCDPADSVASIVHETVRRLRGRHSATANWTDSERALFDGPRALDPASPLSTLFTGHDDVPVLTLRREVLPLRGGSLFRGNVADALAPYDRARIPPFLTRLLALIEERRDTVGVYRKSGEKEVIDAIAKRIEAGGDDNELAGFLATQGTHELACVVKQYLRQINEPLFPSYLQSELLNVVRQNKIETLRLVQNLVRSLPTAHVNLLRALSEHLNRVVEATAANQMTLKSLAICIAPNFIRMSPQDEQLIKMTETIQTVAQLVFENWRFVFLDEPCQLEDSQVKLLEDISSGGATASAGTKVTVKTRGAENVTFEYKQRTFVAPCSAVAPCAPHTVRPFDAWIRVGCEPPPELRYLLPAARNGVRTKGIDIAIKAKLKRIKELDHELSQLRGEEAAAQEERLLLLREEFSKL